MSEPKVDKIPFEEGLNTLQNIIDEMEKGELPLEQSLKKYEQAVALSRHCQNLLQKAEQKIQILTENNSVTEFEHDSE